MSESASNSFQAIPFVPRICLNMIVKNESRIIQRCLSSVLSIIDYVVITDTGSNDNTKELIEEFLQSNNIKGKVYEEPWRNFGYNRTNSIHNAKKFLNEISENLREVYLLFIDADMKIVITPQFTKYSLIPLQAVQIIQQNLNMKYYNTRLCRSDIDITCRGVTHEYYDIPHGFFNAKLESIYIDDIGDGGAKADKFERDIRLLEGGLIDEPKSERYHFYLAQSYHCVGQYHKAIEFYQKRIDLGGWREELYHSHLTIGNIYKDSLKMWDKALFHYMKSFEASGGVRGEGIMKIIEYYKDQRDYHTCMIYMEKMFKIKYPKDDVLFIDYNVYGFKPYYEFSIIAYYINKKQEGLMATQYLLFDRKSELPGYLTDCVRRNTVFYMPRLISSSIERLNNVSISQYYNPSSASFSLIPNSNDSNNLYHGILRTVNYSINDKGQYLYPPHMNYIHTENYWVTLDNNNILTQKKITISPNVTYDYQREYYTIQGLEDGRHFIFNDEIYQSYTSFEYGRDAKASMVLAHMNKDSCEIDRIVSLKYQEDRIQKNWVPFNYKDKFCFVYSYEPFILLEVNPQTGECTEIMNKSNPNINLSELRGSAPPIWLADKQQYLILTHEVLFCETRKYIHRFTLWDEDFNLLKISEPFFFNNLFIEFTLSVIYKQSTNELVIPFSHMDGNSFLLKTSFNNIKWLPKNMRDYFNYFKDLDN